MENVEGKVAIVTGASGGIGLATARLLAEKGVQVVLAARSADKLEALARELPQSLAIQTDVRDSDSVHEMVARAQAHYGRIDVLVNNAGQGMGGRVESLDLNEFRSIIELNVLGAIAAMQAVIPLMRGRGGSIVNVSSGLAKGIVPGVGGYASTKYMLDAISKTARIELAKDGIAVSLVYPFVTATDFFDNVAGGGHAGTTQTDADTPESVAELILEAIQTGEPEFLAEKVKHAFGPP